MVEGAGPSKLPEKFTFTQHPIKGQIVAKIRYVWAAIKYFLSHLGFRPGVKPSQMKSVRDARESQVSNIVQTCSLDQNQPIFYAGNINELSILNEIKNFLESSKTQKLLEIPLSTISGSERHAISLVIDKQYTKLYVLDTKGHDPSKLEFIHPVIGERKGVMVSTFIQDLKNALPDIQGWAIETTSFFQKPMDCAVAVEALVRNLAKQEGERDLARVQQELHENYSNIDEIRNVALEKISR